MNTNPGGALNFFLSIPDDLLVQIAKNDWESLENLCIALTIDVQLMKEYSYENISNRRNVC
tara:strand:+ start:70 stop:252 length:183 start_codon:yes stop_codon:yes gene_type:complete